jgi:hypothetical protein
MIKVKLQGASGRYYARCLYGNSFYMGGVPSNSPRFVTALVYPASYCSRRSRGLMSSLLSFIIPSAARLQVN